MRDFQMELRKNRNKGFSLMEMLIVVAISAMILAMVLISYRVVVNANVTRAARALESSLKSARTTAMSKGRAAGTLTLTWENGNLYAVQGNAVSPSSKELICNGQVDVYAMSDLTYTSLPTVGFTDAKVCFNTGGTLRTQGSEASTFNRFLIQRGNRRFLVTIYAETGAIDVVSM